MKDDKSMERVEKRRRTILLKKRAALLCFALVEAGAHSFIQGYLYIESFFMLM